MRKGVSGVPREVRTMRVGTVGAGPLARTVPKVVGTCPLAQGLDKSVFWRGERVVRREAPVLLGF